MTTASDCEGVVPLFLVVLCLVLSSCAGPHGPTTAAFDGVYQGTGHLTDIGLSCDHTMKLDPLKVAGGHVELGLASGWVQPDGKLDMVYAGIWFLGHSRGRSSGVWPGTRIRRAPIGWR